MGRRRFRLSMIFLGVSEKFLRISSVSLALPILPVPKVSTRTLTGSAPPRASLPQKTPRAVPPRATVGVHDDLAAGEAGVAHRPADHKSSRRVDVILGVFVQPCVGQHSLNDVHERS